MENTNTVSSLVPYGLAKKEQGRTEPRDHPSEAQAALEKAGWMGTQTWASGAPGSSLGIASTPPPASCPWFLTKTLPPWKGQPRLPSATPLAWPEDPASSRSLQSVPLLYQWRSNTNNPLHTHTHTGRSSFGKTGLFENFPSLSEKGIQNGKTRM